MTPKWLSKSSTYSTAIGGASFSPSASVGDMLTGARINAIDAASASEQQQREFIERTMRAASATVTSWTGAEVRASTYSGKDTLVVSGADILARAANPAHAVDFTTGRLLTEASKAAYLKASEVTAINGRVNDYRLIQHLPHRADRLAAQYAGAHLAASIATIRGREKVLGEWPGWAGYFKASEAAASVPEALRAFVNDGKTPAIVRASALLSAQALGLWPEGASAAPDIEAMASAGREHLSALWKRGEMLERADAAVDAMLAAQPEGAEQPQGGSGEGEDGEPQEIPASEADAMIGDMRKPGAHLTSTVTHPAAPEADPADMAGGDEEGDGRFPVRECKAKANDYALRELENGARSMIAALSRIVWESTTPPVFERGQQRGEIDEGALDRLAAYGDDRIFEVRAEKAPTTVGVQVLVDCSGSMGCHTREGTSRIEAAKRVAFALAKAFGNGGRFKVEVAGHSVYYTQHGAQGHVSFETCAKPEDITGLDSGGDNADGYAIAHAVERAGRMRADRRIVLLVADGAPNARAYRGERAARHIRGVVNSAEARGIEFLAVGIEGEMENTGAACFGARRFISIPDTRSAGPLLARAIARVAKDGAA